MLDSLRNDVHDSLTTLTGGDETASAELMELLYAELRALAGNYFRGLEAQTLQPTALVHEAFAKVAAKTSVRYNDRAHFFAICAVTMRHILADHARRRRAQKRGGDWKRVELEDLDTPDEPSQLDALALDEALTELASLNERQARIIEYRFFSGMTVEEVAEVLDISRSTVESDWRMARAWLTVRLERGEAS